MPSPLDLNSIVVRAAQPLSAAVGREVVMVNVEKDLYYGLNKVGARIWELLADRAAVGAICRTLQNEYDVEAAICERQVLSLLQDMRVHGLIEVLEADASPPSVTA